MIPAGGRIAALIDRLFNGRIRKPADPNHLQAPLRTLHKQGLPAELTSTLEGILDEVSANLAHMAVHDRAKVLTILCDGLMALARTGQERPDLLRNYAVTKAQELLRNENHT